MLMKFNWGTGIFISIIIFFIAIFIFLYIAFTNENDLVENDYYPQEIEYQNRIDKVQNQSFRCAVQQWKIYPTWASYSSNDRHYKKLV